MLLVIVKANLYGDNSFTTNGNFLVSNYGVKYNLLLTVNNIEILFKFKRGVAKNSNSIHVVIYFSLPMTCMLIRSGLFRIIQDYSRHRAGKRYNQSETVIYCGQNHHPAAFIKCKEPMKNRAHRIRDR